MPKQAEEIMAGSLSGTMPEVCEMTKRIIMVSPFPGRMHELMRTLMESCFDVLVFHRWEHTEAGALQADLLIFDVSGSEAEDPVGAFRENLHPVHAEVPTLFLVDERMLAGGVGDGAEELLVWPARPHEGLHHVRRILRSVSAREAEGLESPPPAESSRDRLIFKDLGIDRRRMTVHRSGARIDLTKTEYELLVRLIEGQGAVRTREDLLNIVWGTQYFGGSNVVDVHVKSLRKKLGDNAAKPHYVATVRGVGYRLAD
ncbi:response regulator transcription factor [Saccharibacillus sp. CPCC 101409]|uniref:winged helix family transcriptional regulator n=1 Tax=Saccharibacillus sp. CPCC 101409 TaxID=3058041 RepID=UPI0026727498|nr:response regulator transcription factor [Saccharibacillus sp. CPCC 101409]MDO3413065.1 response regulator transcription factor [Saccharibacillus sp. CPCC 101409]